MANFYKLRVAWEGKGRFGVGGNSYVHGDEFILPADQFNRLVKFSDIANGYVEIIGESDAADGDFSTNILNVLQGKSKAFSKNYIPASVTTIVPTTTAGVNGAGYQGTDIANGQVIGRRVGIDKLMYRTPTPSQAAAAPFFLVTTGNPEKVTPSVLRYYDNSAASYGAATNGSIAAAAPITWAANDLLIVGYSEKFASVVWSASAANSATTTVTSVSYWNGSSWVAFNDFLDTTKELQTGTKTLGRTGVTTDTSVRHIWYDKATGWMPGGPAGSGCGAYYCVAIKFSGALTSLAGGTVYPVLDKPVTSFGASLRNKAFDAVVVYDGATYTDYTTEAADTTAGDVILPLDTAQPLYVGSATPFQGLTFDMDVVNDQAATISIKYWNGKAWSGASTVAADAWGGTTTDGSLTGGCTLGQDGTIAFTTVPGAWAADTVTNLTTLGANAPATVSTDNLYWLQIVSSATLKATSAATQMWVATPTSLLYDVAPVGNAFIDANDPIHVTVIDEETNCTVEVKAALYDV